MVTVLTTRKIFRKCTSATVLVVAVSLLAGCASNKAAAPHLMANAKPMSKSAALAEAQTLNAAFKKNPGDVGTAIRFARSLQTMGSNNEAVAVLAETAERQPGDKLIVAAYGKSLLSAGRAEEAATVLKRARALDKNDWRIVSALGLAHDQMKRYGEARQFYTSAAKLAPGEASIFNNMGLSYALDKDLVSAEKALRTASGMKGAEPRVRQNLALIVGLQGRFKEAQKIASMDLPKDMAAQNTTYLRNMLAEPNAWRRLANADDSNPATPHVHENAIATSSPAQPVETTTGDGPVGGPLHLVKSSDKAPDTMVPAERLDDTLPRNTVIGWPRDIFNQGPRNGQDQVVLAARLPIGIRRLKSGGVPE